MSTRQRQVDELDALCLAGAVARAVDLAFEHFAAFGRDDELLARIVGAVERSGASAAVRRRLVELAARLV